MIGVLILSNFGFIFVKVIKEKILMCKLKKIKKQSMEKYLKEKETKRIFDKI
jgi:hypothetical protein